MSPRGTAFHSCGSLIMAGHLDGLWKKRRNDWKRMFFGVRDKRSDCVSAAERFGKNKWKIPAEGAIRAWSALVSSSIRAPGGGQKSYAKLDGQMHGKSRVACISLLRIFRAPCS